MQPEKDKYFYETVVLGAGLPGVFYAINEKMLGKKVLLVNKYGFPGGAVTESLSAFQLFDKNNLHEQLFSFYEKLKNRKDGILFEASTSFILNPESVKIVLLQLLLENNVDLLFHVFPRKIDIQMGRVNRMLLWGKEGGIEVECNFIFDATENFVTNSFFEGGANLPNTFRLNAITTEIMREKIVDCTGIDGVFQLKDGRCLISSGFETDNPDFYESAAQLKIDKISETLKARSCRIQVVPPQSEVNYKVEVSKYFEKFNEKIDAFYSRVGSDYSYNQIFDLSNELIKNSFG